MFYDVDKILLSRLRETFIKIELLNMQDKILEIIEGECISGGINIDGDSSVRRTGTITFLTTNDNYRILEINNRISLNKRVRINIGIKSVESGNETYWFNCGIFILTGCVINATISSRTITVNLQDKMCLHNGEIGGKLEFNTRIDVENVQPDYYTNVAELKNICSLITAGELALSSGCAEMLKILDIIYGKVQGKNYSQEKLIITMKTQINEIFALRDEKEEKKALSSLMSNVAKLDVSVMQKKLLIKDIIKNLAISVAGEKPGKVIVNDIPNKIKTPVRINTMKIIPASGLDGNVALLATFDSNYSYSKINPDENLTVTRAAFENTSVSIDIKNKKFGKGSAKFNGKSSFLKIPDFSTCVNSNFLLRGTVDFWLGNVENTIFLKTLMTVNYDPTKKYGSFSLSCVPTPSNEKETRLKLSRLTKTNTIESWTSFPIKFSPSDFHHIAVCWNTDGTKSTITVFINGEGTIGLELNEAQPFYAAGNEVYIMRDGAFETEYTKANMDYLRISDLARWKKNFSVPVKPYEYAKEVVDSFKIGFKVIDYIYPSDLMLTAGQSAVQGYEACKQALGGNFHYYYDTNGNFVFEEIKNYMNNNIIPLDELNPENYKTSYDNVAIQYDFSDSDIIPTFTNTPQWNNIKNDLYVWGVGEKSMIGYHLAIDEKPFVASYVKNLTRADKKMDWREAIIHNYNVGINYEFIGKCTDETFNELVQVSIDKKINNGAICLCDKASYKYVNTDKIEIVPVYAQEFPRYYRELSSIWFNDRYLPSFLEKPEGTIFNYNLDLIMGDKDLSKFSIDTIGTRRDVLNDTAIKSLYPTKVEEILVYFDDEDLEYTSAPDKAVKVAKIEDLSKYPPYGEIYKDAFSSMQQFLNSRIAANEQVSMTSLPIYYLDVNRRDYISDKYTSISGYYLCKKISFNFTDAGLMNTTFIKAYSQNGGVRMRKIVDEEIITEDFVFIEDDEDKNIITERGAVIGN